MNYAAVDLGTNSCRLLIARIDSEHRLKPVYRDIVTTRIGEGLNETGKISLPAIQRTAQALKKFQGIIDQYEATACRAVATSAAREASNQEYFSESVGPFIDVPIEIISGEDEAWLTYNGVQRGLGIDTSPLVVDPGGGSTEFILVNDNPLLLSLKLGAVRAAEAGMGRKEIEDELQILYEHKRRLAGYPLVIVGGTATTLAAVKMQMTIYEPDRVHGYTLTRLEVNDLCRRMWISTLEERRQMAGVQPERADIIPQGALIVSSIMNILEAESMVVSESDLLEGLIWGLAG